MEKSPIFLEQEKAQELCDICGEILRNARNELYLNLRFMDTALSALLFSPDTQRRGVATDGFCLRFQPEDLVLLYRRGRVYVNRIYLHMVLHCIFLHMDTRRGREKNLWDLSCDIAAEALIDGFLIKALRLPPSPARREMYERLKKQTAVMNAQSIYDALEKEAFSEGRLKRIAAEFYADSHDLWEDDRKPNRSRERQNRWEEIRQTMETEMETFSKMPSGEAGDLRTRFISKTGKRQITGNFSGSFPSCGKPCRWIWTHLTISTMTTASGPTEICLSLSRWRRRRLRKSRSLSLSSTPPCPAPEIW